MCGRCTTLPRRTAGPASISAATADSAVTSFSIPFTVGGPIPAFGITAATSGTSSLTSSGFFGGGQAGFNWQAAPTWVIGAEGDFDAADIEGKANTSATLFSGRRRNEARLVRHGARPGRFSGDAQRPASMAPAAGPMGTPRAPPVRPRSAWGPPPRSVTRRTAGPRAAVSNTPSTHGCRSRPSTSTSISALTASSTAPSPASRSRCLGEDDRSHRQGRHQRQVWRVVAPVGLPSCCEPSTDAQPRTFLRTAFQSWFRSLASTRRPPQLRIAASSIGSAIALMRACRGPLAAAGHCGRPSRKGPKPKALIRSPFPRRVSQERRDGALVFAAGICHVPHRTALLSQFWPTRASPWPLRSG